MEAGKKGFLGFGKKPAVVEVTVLKKEQEVKEVKVQIEVEKVEEVTELEETVANESVMEEETTN